MQELSNKVISHLPLSNYSSLSQNNLKKTLLYNIKRNNIQKIIFMLDDISFIDSSHLIAAFEYKRELIFNMLVYHCREKCIEKTIMITNNKELIKILLIKYQKFVPTRFTIKETYNLISVKKMIMFMMYEKKEIDNCYFDINLIQVIFDFLEDPTNYSLNNLNYKCYLVEKKSSKFTKNMICASILEKYINDIESLKFICSYKINFGNTELINETILKKIDFKNKEIIKLLLENGFDTNKLYNIVGYRPMTYFDYIFLHLSMIYYESFIDLFELFLKFKTKISKECIYNICCSQYLLHLKLIAKYDSNIFNYKDEDNNTLLHLSLINNYKYIDNSYIKYILDNTNKSMLNIKNNDGKTVLDLFYNNRYHQNNYLIIEEIKQNII